MTMSIAIVASVTIICITVFFTSVTLKGMSLHENRK